MSHFLPNLVIFGRLLRALGLDVLPAASALLARALAAVDLGSKSQVRHAARAVLASRREHLPLIDRAVELLFRDASRFHPPFEMGQALRRASGQSRQLLGVAESEAPAGSEGEELPEVRAVERAASERERLARKDFAALSEEEAAAVRQLIRELTFPLALRRTRRMAADRHGAPDLRRTLRKNLRFGGELIALARRRRRRKPRPLVVLADVSGSMEPYSRLLLEFVYALEKSGARREAFAFGTRLTWLTRALCQADPDLALKRAAAAIADWGGGTRIGEALGRFNRDWGKRVLARGAVVVVVSDGWDRGEVEVLEREVARLARSSSRLLWLTPLLGVPGYEPLTQGLRAILPLIDDFLPVHNLKSLEELGALLARLRAS